jgi:hypothetical protein
MKLAGARRHKRSKRILLGEVKTKNPSGPPDALARTQNTFDEMEIASNYGRTDQASTIVVEYRSLTDLMERIENLGKEVGVISREKDRCGPQASAGPKSILVTIATYLTLMEGWAPPEKVKALDLCNAVKSRFPLLFDYPAEQLAAEIANVEGLLQKCYKVNVLRPHPDNFSSLAKLYWLESQ